MNIRKAQLSNLENYSFYMVVKLNQLFCLQGDCSLCIPIFVIIFIVMVLRVNTQSVFNSIFNILFYFESM